MLVRSFTNRNPFVLYARFDAKRLLEDAERRHATHVSVVDKMLQDLLDADEREVLQGYRCILLGGGALNRKTLARALSAKARVYASYGMTETSSQIAHAQVTRDFEGGLRLLPGYRARIVDPNEEGLSLIHILNQRRIPFEIVPAGEVPNDETRRALIVAEAKEMGLIADDARAFDDVDKLMAFLDEE